MKPENIDSLISRYPVIFGTAKRSWIGFSIDEGWLPLVEKVAKDIDKYNQSAGEGQETYITCLKEKFGELRIYCNSSSEEIWNLICDVGNLSVTICEVCGEPGVRRSGSWIKTLCNTHATDKNGKLWPEWEYPKIHKQIMDEIMENLGGN